MFYSILFRNKEQYEQYEQTKRTVEPDCFKDLNLDRIFAPTLKVSFIPLYTMQRLLLTGRR